MAQQAPPSRPLAGRVDCFAQRSGRGGGTISCSEFAAPPPTPPAFGGRPSPPLRGGRVEFAARFSPISRVVHVMASPLSTAAQEILRPLFVGGIPRDLLHQLVGRDAGDLAG